MSIKTNYQTDEENYLAGLIIPLVTHPEEFDIERITDDRGILLTVYLAKEDVGLIVGKQGSTVMAIRQVIRQYGYNNKKRISIRIDDPRER